MDVAPRGHPRPIWIVGRDVSLPDFDTDVVAIRRRHACVSDSSPCVAIGGRISRLPRRGYKRRDREPRCALVFNVWSSGARRPGAVVPDGESTSTGNLIGRTDFLAPSSMCGSLVGGLGIPIKRRRIDRRKRNRHSGARSGIAILFSLKKSARRARRCFAQRSRYRPMSSVCHRHGNLTLSARRRRANQRAGRIRSSRHRLARRRRRLLRSLLAPLVRRSRPDRSPPNAPLRKAIPDDGAGGGASHGVQLAVGGRRATGRITVALRTRARIANTLLPRRNPFLLTPPRPIARPSRISNR